MLHQPDMIVCSPCQRDSNMATSPVRSTSVPTRCLPWRCPLHQVRLYSAAFWERYRDLADWDRHIKNIEKGEARIKRQADIMHAVAVKLDRYRNPWQVRDNPTRKWT